MQLLAFIELILISIQWAKTFQFFSSYLLKIYEAQIENSNYDVPLSAWLVSMEMCLKGIFISIEHLRVQIKAHKENIRTKREM